MKRSRSRKLSLLAATAGAAALMAASRLEGAPKLPRPASVKTGDHIDVPPQSSGDGATPARGGDFDETAVGKAPLKSDAEADANTCLTAAAGLLATQRTALQKQCSDADGNFNTGVLTTGLHRESCTVSQMVTCTGTTVTRAQEEAKRRAAAASAASAAKAIKSESE